MAKFKDLCFSREALEAARWLRDNKHYNSGWIPQNKKPEEWTHLVVSNKKDSISIPVEVTNELKGYLVYDKEGHMFYPNNYLIEYLEEYFRT